MDAFWFDIRSRQPRRGVELSLQTSNLSWAQNWLHLPISVYKVVLLGIRAFRLTCAVDLGMLVILPLQESRRPRQLMEQCCRLQVISNTAIVIAVPPM